MKRIIRFLRSEQAATAVEYSVLLALILLSVIGAIGVFGAESGGLWSSNIEKLEEVGFID